MEKSVFDKYIKAGKIAAEVREASKEFVKIDASILEIAEKIEKMIRDKGAEPAFPVNISLNETAAHYTPFSGDETKIKNGDVVLETGRNTLILRSESYNSENEIDSFTKTREIQW